MNAVNTQKLAELIAFKGRLDSAEEHHLLGIERAIAEIIYIVRMDCVKRIRQHQSCDAAADIEKIASESHDHDTNLLRRTLHGYLEATAGQVDRYNGDFPPVDSELTATLSARKSPAYSDNRDAWFKSGVKIDL